MNNNVFRFLVVFMSLALVGIIAVQVHWVKIVVDNSEEQFSSHTRQVISKVSDQLEHQEMKSYLDRYYHLKDSVGTKTKEEDFLKFGYYQIDSRTNETVIYSNSIIPENNAINSSFFDKRVDTFTLKNYNSVRKTDVYNGSTNSIESASNFIKSTPDITIKKAGRLSILDKAQYEIFFKDIATMKPIEFRISKPYLQSLLQRELTAVGIKTPFEFAVTTKNDKLTGVQSNNFKKHNHCSDYAISIFRDNDGVSKYQLKVNFPQKKKYIFSSLMGIMILDVGFTLIIIIVFVSTITQLIKQRKVSEIKSDFINNMTHEFKTPIATINLALDSIKNPKILEDPQKIKTYLGIIRDENKRMNAQVENVLQISRLEKRELELIKEPLDVHELISDATDHVSLLLEAQEGEISLHIEAEKHTILANDTHFTNLLVNILENAIKYSIDSPVIEITTENVKNLILIRIKDNGQGISKSAQSKIFDKFYREHTGNIHNVKGHGLGLAYVKKIIDEHDAEIFVESEKGKGSTFIIKIATIN